jgi:hypothetical protein
MERDRMFSGELLHIYNGTGSTIAYNGTNYPHGSYVPLGKKTAYKVGYHKLWSSDTGRSMTGENKGTLIGIFPKITVSLGRMSEEDTSAIINLTMQARADVKYYDVGARSLVTASFYFGDVTAELERQRYMYHKGMSFSIIANKKR